MMFLRSNGNCYWAIYGPKGDQISDTRMFVKKNMAIEWAKAYVSSWPDIKLEVEQ